MNIHSFGYAKSKASYRVEMGSKNIYIFKSLFCKSHWLEN